MEHFDEPYDKELNELLRKYLLEETERDRLADEALEMHADFVFSEEPTVLPPAEKEAALIKALQDRAGKGSKGYWKALWLAPLALLLLIGGYWISRPNTTEPIAQQTAPNPIKPILPNTTTNIDTSTPMTVSVPMVDRPYIQNNTASGDAPNINTNAMVAPIANAPTEPEQESIDMKAFSRNIQRRINQYIYQWPAERVYVHTDKDVYQPGQEIWLTTYVRNENDLTPSNISDIVKIQLTDPDGKVVAAQQLIANNGVAKGNIALANGLPEGVYQLKGYTNWQLNNPTQYQFEKDILLTEPDITFNNGDTSRDKLLRSAYPPIINSAIPNAPLPVRMEFYPEGGSMMVGHSGRVAFVAVDKNNDPIEVKGYVTDQTGKQVGTFASSYQGMGYFELQPDAKATYTAHITQPVGINNSYTLPIATSNGLALAIDHVEQDEANITIYSTLQSKALLIAQVRDQIYYSRTIDVNKGDNTLHIPLKGFPIGVAQFTLFNAVGEPVAERLAFVNSYKQLNISIETDKKQYLPREKVVMAVKVTDEKGQPVEGHFSVSVHDANPLARELTAQGNLLSKLLLEPDLGGHVDNGAAYFDKKDPNANNHLDLLLMTRGWRKFTWKELLNEANTTPQYTYERAVIKGTVVDPITLKPLKGVRVQVKGEGVKLLTNNKGKFEINHLDLTQPQDITLSYKSSLMTYVANRYAQNISIAYYGDNRRVFQPQMNDMFHPVAMGQQSIPKDSTVVIGQVKDIFGEGIPKASVTLSINKKVVAQTIANEQGYYVVAAAQPGNFSIAALATGYTAQAQSINIKAGDAAILDLQLITERQSIAEVREAAEKARLRTIAPNKRFNFLPADKRLLAAGDKNTIVDNAPEGEQKDLAESFNDIGANADEYTYYLEGMKMKPNEAQMLSSIRLRSISTTHNGIPARYDASGPVMDISSNAAIQSGSWMEDYTYTATDKNKPSGFKPLYHAAKEYPTIKYGFRERPAQLTDFRQTLYWNGDLVTDQFGKATVEFYNGDDITSYQIDIEGLTAKGETGSTTVRYGITKPFTVKADIPIITDVTKHIVAPIYFTNLTGLQIAGKLDVKLPENLHLNQSIEKDFTIFPPCRDTLLLDVDVLPGKPSGKIILTFTALGYQDVFIQDSSVVKAKPEN